MQIGDMGKRMLDRGAKNPNYDGQAKALDFALSSDILQFGGKRMTVDGSEMGGEPKLKHSKTRQFKNNNPIPIVHMISEVDAETEIVSEAMSDDSDMTKNANKLKKIGGWPVIEEKLRQHFKAVEQ